MLTTRKVLGGLVLAGAAAAAVLFLPTQLGGSTSLVQTRGISMEPAIHAGDLAIVRREASYRVGDVIAYHSATLNAMMLHRIVQVADDSYVTRGDNNSWLDPDRPHLSDVTGRMWLHVPRGSVLLRWLSLPVLLMVAAVARVLSLAQGRSRDQRPSGRPTPTSTRQRLTGRRSTRHDSSSPSPGAPDDGPPRRFPLPSMSLDSLPAPTTPGFAVFSALLAFGALWLGMAAFRQPILVQGSHPTGYQQVITFGYDGRSNTGVAYPDGVLGWGDPVYTKLVDAIRISATHQLTGPRLGAVTGQLVLSARLEGSNGWHGRLTPEVLVPLGGAVATSASLELPLERISTLSAEVEQATGADLGALTVVVEARAAPRATIDGQPVTATFISTLSFRVDGTQLVPISKERSTTSSGTVQVPVQQPGRLHLLSLAIPVLLARLIAIGLALTALLFGITVWAVLRHPPNVAFEMTHRYHGRLVEVQDFETDLAIVDVASAADLFRLADQTGALVLHYGYSGGCEGYVLEHGAACYRFAVSPTEPVPGGSQDTGTTTIPGQRSPAQPPTDLPGANNTADAGTS